MSAHFTPTVASSPMDIPYFDLTSSEMLLPFYTHSPLSTIPSCDSRDNMGQLRHTSVSEASYVPSGGVTKKRQTRAVLACDSCRSLRTKCDERRPACGVCQDKELQCCYSEPSSRKSTKTSTSPSDMKPVLLQNMTSLFDILSANVENKIATSMASISTRVENIEQLVIRRCSIDTRGDGSMTDPASAVERSATSPPPSFVWQINEGKGPFIEPMLSRHHNLATLPISAPRKSSSATFLSTEAMYSLTHDWVQDHELNLEAFPLEHEKGRRGFNHSSSRYEGHNWTSRLNPELHNSHSPQHQSSYQDYAPAERTPVNGSESWPQSSGYQSTSTIHSRDEQHGINHEKSPDFKGGTIARLVQIYMTRVNNMHPILTPAMVDFLVKDFSKLGDQSIGSDILHLEETISDSASHLSSVTGQKKRKRFRDDDGSDAQGAPRHRRAYVSRHPDPSVGRGILLLILALGQFCEYNDRHSESHPHPLSNTGTWSQETMVRASGNSEPPLSPAGRNMRAIDAENQGKSTSAEVMRTGSVSPRQHRQESSSHALPGLDYFGLASEIIKQQWGQDSLQHVQLNLLASIYLGFISRPLDSHTHVFEACRSIQIILRPEMARLGNLKKDMIPVSAQDNPFVFAFWTCLQLESEILDGLDSLRSEKSSGIVQYEQCMPGPNLEAAESIDGLNKQAVQYFAAQISLRKHLNQLDRSFDVVGNEVASALDWQNHFTQIAAAEKNLTKLLDTLPNSMRWAEEELPSVDLLPARLRANFYEAQVITYRQCLLKALERSNASFDMFENSDPAPNGQNGLGTTATIKPTAENIYVQNQVYAEKCIWALVQSLSAYHGLADPVRERLFITNVWGSAHANWRNILILLATYHDTYLRSLVDEGVVRYLYDTTAGFIHFTAQGSPALEIDYEIVRHVGKRVGIGSTTDLDGSFGCSPGGPPRLG